MREPLPGAATAPVSAEEAGEGFFQKLGRIILGSGTGRVAIDTPQAVTALEEEDLAIRQPKILSDVFKAVPGVQTAGASARMLGQALNIRGIGNAEQVASEERIKVTVDGAPKFFDAYRVGPSSATLTCTSGSRCCGDWRPRPSTARA